jgi:hypothetical protein
VSRHQRTSFVSRENLKLPSSTDWMGKLALQAELDRSAPNRLYHSCLFRARTSSPDSSLWCFSRDAHTNLDLDITRICDVCGSNCTLLVEYHARDDFSRAHRRRPYLPGDHCGPCCTPPACGNSHDSYGRGTDYKDHHAEAIYDNHDHRLHYSDNARNSTRIRCGSTSILFALDPLGSPSRSGSISAHLFLQTHETDPIAVP